MPDWLPAPCDDLAHRQSEAQNNLAVSQWLKRMARRNVNRLLSTAGVPRRAAACALTITKRMRVSPSFFTKGAVASAPPMTERNLNYKAPQGDKRNEQKQKRGKVLYRHPE